MKRALLTSPALFLLAQQGCVNDDILLYEVRVHGSVSASETGTLHLEFHHEQSFGSGALAHPLGEFDRRTVSAAQTPLSFDETILYPQQKGQGLIIYGWIDTDGDGVLCAPGKPSEPSGLFRVSSFPAHGVEVRLILDKRCAAVESLFP